MLRTLSRCQDPEENGFRGAATRGLHTAGSRLAAFFPFAPSFPEIPPPRHVFVTIAVSLLARRRFVGSIERPLKYNRAARTPGVTEDAHFIALAYFPRIFLIAASSRRRFQFPPKLSPIPCRFHRTAKYSPFSI